jgi:hypothetical protein
MLTNWAPTVVPSLRQAEKLQWENSPSQKIKSLIGLLGSRWVSRRKKRTYRARRSVFEVIRPRERTGKKTATQIAEIAISLRFLMSNAFSTEVNY